MLEAEMDRAACRDKILIMEPGLSLPEVEEVMRLESAVVEFDDKLSFTVLHHITSKLQSYRSDLQFEGSNTCVAACSKAVSRLLGLGAECSALGTI